MSERSTDAHSITEACGERQARASQPWLAGAPSEIAGAIGAASPTAAVARTWRERLHGASSRFRGPRLMAGVAPAPPPASIAHAPRHWLSRTAGECAFPIEPAVETAVEGDAWRILSCCNPCGAATYCPQHSALMRRGRRLAATEAGPRAASAKG